MYVAKCKTHPAAFAKALLAFPISASALACCILATLCGDDE